MGAGAEEYSDAVKALKREEEEISKIDYRLYEYPFENLALEGGGAKGSVYIGCQKVLEEVGIKPKRVAGASAGAITAALIAAGYNAKEVEAILEVNLEEVLLDHSYGWLSFLPNVIRSYGWNPGKRFTKFMGGLFEKKLGSPDITFKQLYDKTGMELCVIAANLCMQSIEYFHTKTTPNMCIKDAVRMSMGIPGVFQAVHQGNEFGETNVYVDGGVLCNYPIHAFDGWWLSMDQKDSFLNKLQPLSQLSKLMDNRNRFGERNDKTLGFLVYSASEIDVLRSDLEKRPALKMAKRPENSELYKSCAEELEKKQDAVEEHKVFLHALDMFMKTLKEVNSEAGKEADSVINKEELKRALKQAMANAGDEGIDDTGDNLFDNKFTAWHMEILFGADATVDSVFDELDRDGSGTISYNELLSFIERSGIHIQAKFEGYDRCEILSFSDFASGLLNCLQINIKKLLLSQSDIDRTVGINSDYVDTTDFSMQPVDKAFLVEQGRLATICFLQNYVHKNNPPLKSAAKKTSS